MSRAWQTEVESLAYLSPFRVFPRRACPAGIENAPGGAGEVSFADGGLLSRDPAGLGLHPVFPVLLSSS